MDTMSNVKRFTSIEEERPTNQSESTSSQHFQFPSHLSPGTPVAKPHPLHILHLLLPGSTYNGQHEPDHPQIFQRTTDVSERALLS